MPPNAEGNKSKANSIGQEIQNEPARKIKRLDAVDKANHKGHGRKKRHYGTRRKRNEQRRKPKDDGGGPRKPQGDISIANKGIPAFMASTCLSVTWFITYTAPTEHENTSIHIAVVKGVFQAAVR